MTDNIERDARAARWWYEGRFVEGWAIYEGNRDAGCVETEEDAQRIVAALTPASQRMGTSGYEKREPVVVDDAIETEDVCGNCNAGIPDNYRRQVDEEMVERGADAISEWHTSSYVDDNDRALARAVLNAALDVDRHEGVR